MLIFTCILGITLLLSTHDIDYSVAHMKQAYPINQVGSHVNQENITNIVAVTGHEIVCIRYKSDTLTVSRDLGMPVSLVGGLLLCVAANERELFCLLII